ncbi:MAG: metalloprotease TldD [Proteobacteria bacterium]|jgi:TldD protein|nr:metalloprotease TldD [Pseudomonadota bacterium]
METNMIDIYQIASDTLLAPYSLSESGVTAVLNDLAGKTTIDYADLYFQYSRSESWQLDQSCVKNGSFSIDKGVGLRAVVGDKTAFAYSDDMSMAALREASGKIKSIARQGQERTIKLKRHASAKADHYKPVDPIQSLDSAKKIEMLNLIDQLARAKDPRVMEVTASIGGGYEVILVVRPDGGLVPDVRPMVRMNVSVIVEQSGRRETGSSGGGGRTDYLMFTPDQVSDYVNEAVRQACINLEAKDAPAGTMEVVLGPGWPGVLLHEAVGHGLEGDFNRKGTSTFAGRMGEQVASPLCTVVDNGTIEGRRGSLNVDDEGNPTQNNVLIENGVLKGYMQDSLNARLMNVPVTGNARRESFACLPMPRMTNTYMLSGASDPEEIVASIKNGIYAVNFGGGQVDITSGKFVFSANEAYRVKNGKVIHPVRGATLIGDGPEVMQQVSMVGNDLALDAGVGVCGKDGQSVPVGVGQPTIKVGAITVGGVKA